MQPRGYQVTIENLNLKKDYIPGMFRLHTTLELERNLANEISNSPNPWIYVIKKKILEYFQEKLLKKIVS